METLVAVAHHRNQYYSGSSGKANSSMRFGSSSSRGFRDINCRSFEADVGLLRSPFESYGSPESNLGFVTPKPKTTQYDEKLKLPCSGTGGKSKSENLKLLKRSAESSPIEINFKGAGSCEERLFRENMSISELWAGPTYSNSPPPSSLPMPNFSFKPKRTVSLELPVLESDLEVQPMSKSAPASPTREGIRSSNGFFHDDENSATKTLRRILNLDIVD